MESLVRSLIELGLSDKEAFVYVATLELGLAGAQKIAIRARVNRATSYAVLEGLKGKGLVMSFTRHGEQRFAAESPERLVSILESEEESSRRKLSKARELLSSLQARHNLSGRKPKVRYVEGVDGLKMMRRDQETLEADIIQIIGYDAFLVLNDPYDSKEHQTRLRNQKRRVRSIVLSSRPIKVPPGLAAEVAVLPPEMSPIKGEVSVCGNRVMMFSYADGIVALEIESSTLADTMRLALELAWREAKRLA